MKLNIWVAILLLIYLTISLWSVYLLETTVLDIKQEIKTQVAKEVQKQLSEYIEDIK